ncbi:B-cell receptor CD22-like isoform X2 [Clupea harengus]|uniref:B-cell receptor CD22-like isoform X2 n=1 Tax=Clupea harengus TaxID=7950 RepID=A0A6P8F9X2_CLUHA|nr:B-cell receptor CD22-like isoform X2 [Clupea harengus]
MSDVCAQIHSLQCLSHTNAMKMTCAFFTDPPENTSAYVCPPGETSEGSSVTLVCSSDANPPVHTYTWYQKTRTGHVWIGSGGQNYTITNVSSEHSGDYYCSARNMLNGAISAMLKLDVKYPPRSPQTVLRPAGDLVEGSSMTLTCSSEAHPPVHTYTWYRGRGADSRRVGGGQNYSTSNMTYGHSGEYHCQAENLKGSRNSTTVFVDVLYPPRNVSLSVSSVDGSITLTCTSDANPPVQNYTWHRTTGADTSPRFMETTGADSSQRGTGRRLTLEAAESGIYYCEAMNEVGASRSNLLPISEKYTAGKYAVVVVIVAIGALIVISSIWLRKKHLRVTEITEGTDDSEQDGSSPVYVNVSRMAMASDPKKDRADTENEILYSSVHFKQRDKQEVSFNSTLQNPKLHPPEDDNEALYCTVKFHQP